MYRKVFFQDTDERGERTWVDLRFNTESNELQIGQQIRNADQLSTRLLSTSSFLSEATPEQANAFFQLLDIWLSE